RRSFGSSFITERAGRAPALCLCDDVCSRARQSTTDVLKAGVVINGAKNSGFDGGSVRRGWQAPALRRRHGGLSTCRRPILPPFGSQQTSQHAGPGEWAACSRGASIGHVVERHKQCRNISLGQIERRFGAVGE